MIPGIVAAQQAGGGPPPPSWATWNPGDKSASIDLTGGNLIATRNGTADGTTQLVRATSAKSSGKWYFEVLSNTPTVSPFILFGLAPSTLSLSSFPGATSDSWAYYQQSGEKWTNNSGAAYGAVWDTDGDIIGLAVDLTAGKVWWAKNGVYQGGGDPAAGTAEAFSGLTGSLFPAAELYRNTQMLTARFDPAAQTYSAPSGFTAGWTA